MSYSPKPIDLLNRQDINTPRSDVGKTQMLDTNLNSTLNKDREMSNKQLGVIEKIKDKEKIRFEKHLRLASENNKKIEK